MSHCPAAEKCQEREYDIPQRHLISFHQCLNDSYEEQGNKGTKITKHKEANIPQFMVSRCKIPRREEKADPQNIRFKWE